MTVSVRHRKALSPLLRLPGELRNRIYFYVFAEEQFRLAKYGFNTHMFPYINRRENMEPHPYRLGLLSVCRQIYAEVALLPFIMGTVEIDNVETLEEMSFRLTTSQCSAIRTLRLTTPLGGNANIVKLFVSKSRKRGLWLKNYLHGVRKVEVEIVRDCTQQLQRCQSGISFLQRTRLHQRREQTVKWLTGSGGTGIEIIFSGYGMCGSEIVHGNWQWWEKSCKCC